jgi:hypothetical protein
LSADDPALADAVVLARLQAPVATLAKIKIKKSRRMSPPNSARVAAKNSPLAELPQRIGGA